MSVHSPAHAANQAANNAPQAAPSAAPAASPQASQAPDGSLFNLLKKIKASALAVADAAQITHAEEQAKAHAGAKAAPTEAASPNGERDGGNDTGKSQASRIEKIADLGRIFREGEHVYRAWQKGDLQDKDTVDFADAILDWANVDWARFFVGPFAWGLKKLLGARKHVDDIEPDFENLGDQILAWPEDRDGGFAKSCEGFIQGVKERKDVNALNRKFRHFHQKTLFDKALKEDKASLQKSIAALLGLEGEVSESEVANYIGVIVQRLGACISGTPGSVTITPNPVLRAALDPKHRAVLKLYENALNWLDTDTLEKINSDVPAEKPFTIDFETFGDLLLEEVNPKNRDRYLKGIDPAIFLQTFKTKFLYLTHEADLKAALKKPDQREIVLEQLRHFTGVKNAMTIDSLKDHIATLLGRIGTKPTLTPPTVPATKAPLELEYEAFETALNLVLTTFTNTDALKELYGNVEQQKPIDYNKIGEEIMARTKTTAALKTFEAQFDQSEMFIPYGVLLDERDLLAEASSNPERLMATLGKFYGLSGTLTNDRIERRVKELSARLKQSPIADVPEAHQLADNIDTITKRIVDNNILTPKWDYSRLGEQMIQRVKIFEDLQSANKSLNSVDIEFNYGSLFDFDVLKDAIEADAGRVRSKLAGLLAIEGSVTAAAVKQQINALKKLLSMQDPTGNIISSGAVFELLDNLNKLGIALSTGLDDTLTNKLFNKEQKVETPVSINYAKFGEAILAIPAKNLKEQERCLKAFDETAFGAEFGALTPKFKDSLLTTDAGRKLLKAQTIALFKLSDPFDRDDVLRQAKALRERLGDGAVASAEYTAIDAILTKITTEWTDARIGTLFAEVTPSSVEDFIGTFRDLEDEDQVAAMVRGYRSSAFRARLNYMVDTSDFAEALKPESTSERAEAIEQVRLFVGQNTGSVRYPYLEQVVKEFEDKLATLNKTSLSTADQIRYDAMANDFADIKNTLAVGNLKRLFEQKAAVDETPFTINYRQFGNEIFNLADTANEQKRFLLGFKVDRFEASQTAFYPLARISGKLKNPQDRTRLKAAIANLFYLTDSAPSKVEKSELDQQIRLMGLALGGGSVEKTKYDELMIQLNEVATALDGSLAELYADAPEVMEVKPENIGTILKAKINSKEDAIAFLRGYSPAYIRNQFNVLADATAFDASHAGADRREVVQMQTMLRAFVGLNMGHITPKYLDETMKTFNAALGLAAPNKLPADLKAKYDAFLKLAKDIFNNLKANDRLEKLFNPDAVTIDYDKFGECVQKLNGAQALNFLRELNTGLLGSKLTKFTLELHLDNVSNPKERAELRTALANFLGAPQDVVLTRNDITTLIAQMLNRFGEPRALQLADGEAYSNLVYLGRLAQTVLSNLTDERLANIYKGAKARKKTP